MTRDDPVLKVQVSQLKSCQPRSEGSELAGEVVGSKILPQLLEEAEFPPMDWARVGLMTIAENTRQLINIIIYHVVVCLERDHTHKFAMLVRIFLLLFYLFKLQN